MSYVVFPDRVFSALMVSGPLPFTVQIAPDPAPLSIVNVGCVLMEHGNPGYVPGDYWSDNYQPQIRLITQGGATPAPPVAGSWRVNPVFLIP